MTALPTLRQLRHLAALAEHGHFGRAAAACFVTQSALSASLKELEAVLGAVLVERTRRSVTMTPLGAEIAARGRRVLREVEDLAALAAAAREPLSGELRLGVIPTVGPYLLPRAMPVLRAAHPRLRLYLREDRTARLLERLMDGALDAVLLALPYRTEGVVARTLAEDPFYLACPRGHRLAAPGPIAAETLAGEALLLLEEGHCLRDHALSACRLPPGDGEGEGFRATSLATLVQMVAGGLGVTLLPAMAIAAGILKGTGIVVRPLEGDGTSRTIGLVWRRSSSRGEEFVLLGEIFAAVLERPPASAGGTTGKGRRKSAPGGPS